MTVPMKDNVSEGNKERCNCFKNSNYWIIWLPDGSVGQCGNVRAILLHRFGLICAKMGGCGGGGGEGGGREGG